MIQNMGLHWIIAIFMTLVFLLSGVAVNCLQALLYITLYRWNRGLYRKINYYLICTIWTQIVAVCEWWSNSGSNLWGDEEALRLFGKEHCMIVMNHKYDVDWLMTWFICDKLGMLGNAKTLAKKSLRNVPIIGWGWVFAEMIFLERNWEKDKVILRKGLSNLVEYKDPIMILYFCEGTRFTPEKHQASMEFAKARNLPQLKHHLCPRTSGFSFAAAHLKDKVAAVYDVQLAFPETPIKPTFLNMLKGHSFSGDILLRRFPMSEIPTDSDEATSKWLHQLYQEKDQHMDDYLKTNRFPGRCMRLQRSYRSLLNSVFWILVVGVPFLYLVFKLLTMGSFLATSITVSIIVILFSSMYLMVRATNASKGSSYGKDKSPSKVNNGAGDHDTSPLQPNDLLQNNHSRETREQIVSNENRGGFGKQVVNNENHSDISEQSTCNENHEDVQEQVNKNREGGASEQLIGNENYEVVREQVVNNKNHEGDVGERGISNENHENVQERVINNKVHEDVQKQFIHEENLQKAVINNENHNDVQDRIIANENHPKDLQGEVISNKNHEDVQAIVNNHEVDGQRVTSKDCQQNSATL